MNILNELTRERQMVTEGRDRFLKRQEKLTTTTSIQNNPQKLMSEVQELVAEELKKTIDSQSKLKGRAFSWYQDLKEVDVDIIAYSGLTTMFDSVGRSMTLTRTITAVGHKVEMEIFRARLKEFNSRLAKRIEEKVVKDHSSDRYRVKAARSIAFKSGFKIDKWEDKRKVIVGTPIVNAILKVSNIFDIWEDTRKNKTVRKIGILPEASDRLADLDFEASWREPMFAPMIVEPKGWDTFDSGCYMDQALAEQVKLVKGYVSPQHRKAIERGFRNDTIRPAIDAINAVQRTKLKLNPIIVEAVEWCWSEDKEIHNFPLKNHLKYPPKVDNFDELNDDQKKGLRIRNRKITIKNREIDGTRAVMLQDLKVAKDLMQYENFYLPHNFDHRGRIYPIPHFCHHRDDHIRAMFELGESKPVDQESFYWIAIQVANTGDFDKVSKKSLKERVDWVLENDTKIIETGLDYKKSFEFWSKADKPFAFLAACVAYTKYLVEGEGSLSGLPINLDGSNSGIQHYSASSLQEGDGALVNLIPSDKPQDIYQAVADKVKHSLDRSDDALAEDWLKFGISRKLVKRNVMTFGYSSEVYGFKEQIMEDTMKPLRDDVLSGRLEEHPFGEDEGFKASNFLAKQNWSAVNQVITGASEGMKFFKTLSRLLAHENKHTRWVTPMGFPVVQSYTKFTTKEIKVYLYDRTLQKNVRTQISLRDKPLRKVDKTKSASAISPNVIHSMDASHLLKTVIEGLYNNIRSFFLIHDSFATTPTDTAKLSKLIRKAFVEMYTNYCLYTEVLKENKEQFTDIDKVKLPEIPSKGGLDLEAIKDSRYCFC